MWAAYAEAFQRRYGEPPARSATTNGQLANLIGRIGKDEAPHVAAFYLTLNDRRFVEDRHSPGLLLNKAHAVRTRWVTRDRPMSATLSAAGHETLNNLQSWEPGNGTTGP